MNRFFKMEWIIKWYIYNQTDCKQVWTLHVNNCCYFIHNVLKSAPVALLLLMYIETTIKQRSTTMWECSHHQGHTNICMPECTFWYLCLVIHCCKRILLKLLCISNICHLHRIVHVIKNILLSEIFEAEML